MQDVFSLPTMQVSAIPDHRYTEDISKAGDPPTMRNATDDMYVFSKAQGQWEQLKHGHKGMPTPRARLSSQLVCVGDHLYLIAGWDPAAFGSGGDVLSDMWRYNLRTNTWSQLDPQGGQCLGAISRFQAVAVGALVYIHSHRSLCDIHVLDTGMEPPVLHKLAVTGDGAASPGPPSRGLHSVVAMGGRLLLFGGAPKEGPMMDDLWSLDLASLRWARLSPTGARPAARCSHFAGSIDGRYMWVVGGAHYASPGKLANVDDVAVYDSEADAWVEVDVAGPRPSARNAGVAVSPLRTGGADGGGQQALLHAGWKAFAETYNDTFLLTLQASRA
ncbi:MAG: hypothetical protein WDW36_007307 [Sanguina aurantia]